MRLHGPPRLPGLQHMCRNMHTTPRTCVHMLHACTRVSHLHTGTHTPHCTQPEHQASWAAEPSAQIGGCSALGAGAWPSWHPPRRRRVSGVPRADAQYLSTSSHTFRTHISLMVVV